MDDLEKRLSDVLHELTPEPPPFRFEPVDEVGAARRRVSDRPRRLRTFGRPLLAAAAAAIVLGVGGVVALVGGGGSSAPAGEGPVSRCAERSDFQLFLNDVVVKRGEVLVTVLFFNNGRSCTLDGSPVVGMEPDVASSTPAYLAFPVRPRGTFVFRGHRPTVLDVRMAAEGTCQVADERPLDPSRNHQAGLVYRAPFGSTGPDSIGLFGCRLTPTSVRVGKEP